MDVFGGLGRAGEEPDLERGREKAHRAHDPTAAEGFGHERQGAAGSPAPCDGHQRSTAKPETVNTDKRAVIITVLVQLARCRRGEDALDGK